MPVSLYFDHNINRAIAQGLRRRGVDVLTAAEDGAHRLPDDKLLDRATALGRVLVSADTDFIEEAHRRQTNGVPFSGVVIGRQGLPIGLCVEQLELIAKVSEPDDFSDTLVFLPLR